MITYEYDEISNNETLEDMDWMSLETNLTEWQLTTIANFSSAGRQCMIQFWTSTERPIGKYCNATWDTILCWPATPANTTVRKSCPSDLDSQYVDAEEDASDVYAYRTCDVSGNWLHGNWTDYTLCMFFLLHKWHTWYYNREEPEFSGARILRDIYFYGGIISCILLLATIFIFVYFKQLHCCRISIHKNLVVSFMIRSALFIFYFEPFVTSRLYSYRDISWLCKALMVVDKYSVLTSIAWMFVEGLFLHGRVTTSVFNASAPLYIYYVVGWCAPLVPTAIWTICMELSNHEACWSRLDENYYKISWIISGSVLAALSVNCIFLVNIIRIVLTKMTANNTMESDKFRKAVKATALLFPLLGTINVLFLMESGGGSLRLAYRIANAVLQSSQGILVSVFYCFLNEEVKMVIRKKWQRYKSQQISKPVKRTAADSYSRRFSARSSGAEPQKSTRQLVKY